MDVTNRINYNNSSNNSYLGGDCSLDELTTTFSSLRLSAFTSAAIASRQSLGVSIGPNVTIDDHEKYLNNSNDDIDKSETPKNYIKTPDSKSKSTKKSTRKSILLINDDEDPYQDSEAPSPKAITIDDVKSLSEKLQKQKSNKEIAEKIRKEMAERADNFYKADKLREEKYLEQTKNAENNFLQRMKENERLILEAIENEEHLEKEFEESQKIKIEEVKKRELNLKERSRALEKFRAVHALFKQSTERFMKSYTDLDKQMQNVFVNYKSAVYPLMKSFEAKVLLIGKGNLSTEETTAAEKIQKQMDNITNDMISKINEVKLEYQNAMAAKKAEEDKILEAKKQIEAENRAKEEAAARLQAKPNADTVDQPSNLQAVATTENNLMSQFVSREALARYDHIMKVYKQHSEAVKKLSEDETMMKYRMNCQIAVNTPINAISAVSPEHLLDKFLKLEALLRGDMVKPGAAQVSVLQHPLGKTYVTLLLSRKFVNQSDTIMSNNAKAEFPIAAILVALWQKFPEVGQFFLAYLYKECPYFVPYFIPQIEGQTDEEYMKSLGYRITTEKTVEKHDLYLKRMSGIARLYAAVWITNPRRGETSPHPHNLSNGWRWLCEILNLDPLPDICATLIYEVLQVAGHAFTRLYGKQFFKLLYTIQNQYFVKLSLVDHGGPKARLEDFVQKALREQKIDPPEGMLPLNFW